MLAVVMDEQKRTRSEWIRDGIARAIKLARDRDARTCVVPDFTEDLLRQPRWITGEQRHETCGPIARAMLEGILAGGTTMDDVRIWVWRSGNEDVFIAELERMAIGTDLAIKSPSVA